MQQRLIARARVVVMGALGLAAFGLLGSSQSAQAAPGCTIATINWDGSAGTTAWHTAANWTPERLPTTTDHVCIPSAAPGASVAFNGASVSVLSVDARKPVSVAAGTLTLTSATQASSFTKGLNVAGGTVTGAVAKTLEDASVQTSGVLAGPVTIAPGATYEISGPDTFKRFEGTITNNGTLRLNGFVTMANLARIDNVGVIDFIGNSIVDCCVGSSPQFINNTATGLIRTTGGTSSIVEVAVENDGTISGQSGTLELQNGTPAGRPSAGTYTAVAGGPTVAFMAGTHTMEAGNQITGPGVVTLGGSATLTGPFKVAGGATLAWTDSAHLTGPIPASGTTGVIDAGGLVTVDTDVSKRLGGALRVDGTLRIAGSVATADQLQITNNSLIEMVGESVLDCCFGSGQQIINQPGATISKTSGAVSIIEIPVDNDGTVTSTAGTLQLAAGTGAGRASTGTYTAPNGGPTVMFAAGIHTMAAGNQVTGPGPVTLGGAATLTGPYHVAGGGTLAWTDSAFLLGPLPATGNTGVIDAGGLVVTDSDPGKRIGGVHRVDGTLRIGGTVAAEDFLQITNNSLLEMQGEAFIDCCFGSGQQIVNQPGATITKTSGAVNLIEIPVDNDGTVTSTAGALQLSAGTGAGHESTGTYTAANGGPTVSFTGGVHTMGTGNQVKGPGIVGLAGSADLAGPLRVVSGGQLSWSENGFLSGPVPGTGDAIIESGGLLTVSPTGSKRLSGSVRIEGHMVVNGYLAFSNAALLTNAALLDLNGETDLDCCSGTPGHQIVNTPTGLLRKVAGTTSVIDLPVENDGIIRAEVGTLNLAGGTGSGRASSGRYTSVTGGPTVAFTSGIHTMETGHAIAGPGVITLAGNATLTGPVRVLPGATLDWKNSAFLAGPVPGNGEAIIQPGALVVTDTSPGKRLIGAVRNLGTLRVRGPLTMGDKLNLVNNGRVELAGEAFFDCCSGTGHLFVNEMFGTVIKTSGTLSEIELRFDNRGTVIADTGQLRISDLANLNDVTDILTGGTWLANSRLDLAGSEIKTIAADLRISGTGSVTSSDTLNGLRNLAANRGRLQLADGASLTMTGPLTNDGIVTVDPGSTLTAPSVTQRQGRTSINGSGRLVTTTGFTVDGGAVTGNGTVVGALTNTGLQPPVRLRPDKLNVEGSYTQGAAGVLDVRLDGSGTGKAQIQLKGTGAATLAGTLRVRIDPGFTPAVGDKYTLVDFGSVSGEFTIVDADPLDGFVLEVFKNAKSAGVVVRAA